MKAMRYASRLLPTLALLAPVPAAAQSCAIAIPEGAGPHPSALVGTYDGGQTEVAAFLALAADGSFEYELAYGALDETAKGHWSYDGSGVVLATAAVVAPRFIFLGEKLGPAGALHVTLDLPSGIDRQYFDAHVTLTGGQTIMQQLAPDGLDLEVPQGSRPASIALALPIYDLMSEPAPLSGSDGVSVAFRFEPNDIGKVAFDGTVLPIEDCALTLDRFDRHLRFRKVVEQQDQSPN